MTRSASLPVKLSDIHSELQDLLEREIPDSERWALIFQASQAIDRVIREFEREGICRWIPGNPDGIRSVNVD